MNRIEPRDAHIKPQPIPDPDTEAYWLGLRHGQLLLQHCLDCGHVQFYQQAICRQCTGERLEHRAASGLGHVHTFSVVHRAPGPAFKGDVPYAVLLVELDEGPRMISALTGGDPDTVNFGMRVQLVCEAAGEGVVLPLFKPA